MRSRVWPGDFPVFQGFGKTQFSSWHDGIDIDMPIGTELYAPANGQNHNLVDKYGANYQFIVYSDGSADLLVHLNDFVAPTGLVHAGQLISHSGNTGNSTGAHLHFTHRSVAGDPSTAVDPTNYLQGGGDDMLTPELVDLLCYDAFQRPATPDDVARYTSWPIDKVIKDIDGSDEHKRIANAITIELPKLRGEVADIPNQIEAAVAAATAPLKTQIKSAQDRIGGLTAVNQDLVKKLAASQPAAPAPTAPPTPVDLTSYKPMDLFVALLKVLSKGGDNS